MNRFKRIRQSLHAQFQGIGFSPRVDWHMALTLSTIWLALICVTSALIFIGITTHEPEESLDSASAVSLDSKKLSEIAERFRNRSVTAEPDAIIFVDPSK